MDSVVDLAESRKAKSEKNRQLRQAANELLMVLDQHREELSEEFMTFLLAMMISDQALYYAQKSQQWQVGEDFFDNLVETARQLFQVNSAIAQGASLKARPDTASGQVLSFVGEAADKSQE